MKRSTRFSIFLASTAAVAVMAPAVASAASVAPATLNFGNQAAGTTSAPKTAVVTVPCGNIIDILLAGPVCVVPGIFTPAISSSSAEFVATNDCGPFVLANTVAPVTCTITVSFKPSGVGTRSGTIATGANPVAVSGTGTAASGVAGVTAKKCKKKGKKRSAAAAKKKCKKKKKK